MEPTNNLAEQTIRFVVIDRRITQGTRTLPEYHQETAYSSEKRHGPRRNTRGLGRREAVGKPIIYKGTRDSRALAATRTAMAPNGSAFVALLFWNVGCP